jgi:hypothetical protein
VVGLRAAGERRAQRKGNWDCCRTEPTELEHGPPRSNKHANLDLQYFSGRAAVPSAPPIATPGPVSGWHKLARAPIDQLAAHCVLEHHVAAALPALDAEQIEPGLGSRVERGCSATQDDAAHHEVQLVDEAGLQ